ncbi:hypothetical protein [Ktedonobacter racemifer]|uniref:Uncharacterized protein n=1 Tax=Ktedonobacter racemifer DSM 44963 TaxID=485913 RepID=D6TXF2_KTERA|nr:hypothetical protein [Ktedonobacter racemifer]EFH84885.1 hypothetical protein Krac_6001 [Ktedonobacter racemifer DSM 44963]
MRREDARYRFLLQELEAFTAVYRKTAQAWFVEFTRDSSHVTDQEHGYRRVFPGQLLARIEGFDTPKQLFQPFGPLPQPARFFLPYRDIVLTPFNDEITRQLVAWWHKEWRRQFLDFAHIPPAPPTRPRVLIPCGFRTWRYTDQFLVRIEGGVRTRHCQVSTYCTGYAIWRFPLPPAPLRLLPPLLLPRLHRLAGLTDWRQLEQLPPAVHRALSKRVAQLITFYTTRPLQVTPLPLPSHTPLCQDIPQQQSMQRTSAHE